MSYPVIVCDTLHRYCTCIVVLVLNAYLSYILYCVKVKQKSKNNIEISERGVCTLPYILIFVRVKTCNTVRKLQIYTCSAL